MTRRERLPELKSVSLRLHASTRTLTWAIIYRTTRGDSVFDRRVSSGQLEHQAALVGPETVVLALEAAIREIRRLHGLPLAVGDPGAPGGGGGRLTPSQESALPTVPLSVVRDSH